MVLTPELKREIFYEYVEKVRDINSSSFLVKVRRCNDEHGGDSKVMPWCFLPVQVTRGGAIVDIATQQILTIPAKNLVRKMSVQFRNEPGLDAGGLKTELLQIIFSVLCSPDNDLFEAVEGNPAPVYLPTPDDKHMTRPGEIDMIERVYEGIGRYLAKA